MSHRTMLTLKTLLTHDYGFVKRINICISLFTDVQTCISVKSLIMLHAQYCGFFFLMSGIKVKMI